MNIKKVARISAISLILIAAAVLISNKVFASGSNGGGSGSYGDCPGPETGFTKAACTTKTSWRYYSTSNPVTFTGYKGTGGGSSTDTPTYTVSDCSKEGGFWFHGFESFNAVTGAFNGYQVPIINKGRGTTIFSGTSGAKTASNPNAGGVTGRLASSLDEVKDAYKKAREAMIYQEGADPDKWLEWDSYDSLIYFCYKQENAAYEAMSSVNISGGQEANTTWSSSDNTGNTARKQATKGDEVSITFEHKLKQSGSGTLNGTTYSVSTDGGSGKGESTFNQKNETSVYSENITVTGEGTYCSTITYDNKATNEKVTKKNVTSKICAEVSFKEIQPDPPEEVEVVFSAQSEVKAYADINAINEATGEVYVIPAGTVLGTGAGMIDSLTGALAPQTILTQDDTVSLQFLHSVTRVDSETKVSTAYTHTILTPPSLSATPHNIGSLLKTAYFGTSTFVNKLKSMFSSDSFSGALTIDDATKRKLKDVAGDTAGLILSTNYYSSVLKLRTNDLAIGATDDGYETHGNYKPTGDGQDYCQALIYQNVRTVYTDESMEKIKESEGISTGNPIIDKLIKVFKNLVSLLVKIFNGEDTSGALQDLANSLGNLGKTLLNQFSQFVEQLGNDSAPISSACVRLKKAFDFNVDLEPVVNEEVAIVGQDLTFNSDSSNIITTPLHTETLTDTSQLRIEVVNFWIDKDDVNLDSLKGNWTTDTNSRSALDPCAYYQSIANARDCKKKEDLTTYVPKEGNRAQKPLSYFGIGKIAEPVPDVQVGSLFCFAIGVRDSDSDSYMEHAGSLLGTGRWAISGATCRTVAKKPSLNITGGSVYSGDKITAVTTKKGSNVYGSWVEYGAIAKNLIEYNTTNKGFSSGNMLRAGSDKDILKVNPLTITNTDKNTLGNSGIDSNEKLLKRIATIFKAEAEESSVSTLQSDCSEPIGCYYNISGDITGLSNVTGTHIIYSSGDITIKGNITYAPSASEDNLPQVVIISDGNINIENSVSRVDAWLVAEKGSINTCSNIGGIGTFTADSCATNLTINGPVISVNLSDINKNYRTGGSGVGADSATPASTFNLPASTYVWAYNVARETSDSYYQTYVTEFAPRY